MQQAERVAGAVAALTADRTTTGIFTDFDGTLSSIVERPEDAVPVPGAEQVLVDLAGSFGLVAVVSGRALEDLKTKLRPPGVLLAGSYGRERSDRPLRRATEGWETVSIAANATARTLPGVRVERKGTGVALHYRSVPELADDVRAAASVLASEFGLEIRPGRMVVELIAPGPGKGDAIAKLVTERGLERALVAGDDYGDLEAFTQLRTSGVDLVAVAVTSDEGPPGLSDAADLVVRDQDELVAFLRLLVD